MKRGAHPTRLEHWRFAAADGRHGMIRPEVLEARGYRKHAEDPRYPGVALYRKVIRRGTR